MPGSLELFADGEPPGYIDVGEVQIFFGCSDAGYLGTFASQDSPEGSTKFVFTDIASACISGEGGLPANQDVLDSLAKQFGEDFLGWYRTQFDYVFDGTVNIQPNGFIDEIEFDHSSEMAKTRIRSAPWNGWATNLGHDDPGCPAGPSMTVAFGVTTGVITAREGSKFGKGPFQIYKISSPTAATPGQTITVRNWYSSQVNGGKYFIIFKIGCVWFLGPGDC